MPSAYQRGLANAVFTPFAADLAARAAALTPARVLELAAGTGVLTSELLARLPSAEIVASDLNESMVELGNTSAPNAPWVVADAMHLPFAVAAFDLVICQFGAMFFPDKPAAFNEANRVLADVGTCLLNAWGPVEDHQFESAVVAACDRLFPLDHPRFLRSVPHHYAAVKDLVADVEAGGLQVSEVEDVVLESPPVLAQDVAAGYCFGTPLRYEIETRGGEPEVVVRAIGDEIESRLGASPVKGSMRAHVLTCVKLPASRG
jgi:SAM-dependent methyltransferase